MATAKGTDIKQIKLPVINPQTGQPTGDYTLHNVHDAVAREAIGSWGKITRVLGVATTSGAQTAPTDGGAVGPLTIKGATVIAQEGEVVLYKVGSDTSYTEFLAIANPDPSGSGLIWDKLDETEKLGDLAYVNTAEAELALPNWDNPTGDHPVANINFNNDASVSTTLAATAQSSKVSLTGGSSIDASKASLSSITVKSAKTLPKMEVSGEVLIFSAGETEDKLVIENSVHASTINFVAIGDSDSISKIVTASPTGGTADAQIIQLNNANSVTASVQGTKTTVTVKP